MLAIDLCYIITYIVEGLIIYRYFTTIYELKVKKAYAITFYILVYGIMYIFSKCDSVIINGATFIIGNFLIGFLFYRSTLKMSVVHSVICYMIMALSELLVMAVIPVRFDDYYNSKQQGYVFYIISLSVLSKLLYFAISRYVSRRFAGHKVQAEHNHGLMLLGLVPVLSSVTILTLTIVLMRINASDDVGILVAFSSFAIMIINIIVYSVYDYNMAVSKKNEEMLLVLQREDDLVNYYKQLDEKRSDQQILIHDIKNHLNSLLSLVSDDKCETAVRYIENILNLKELNGTANYSNIPLVNGTLNRYKTMCDKCSIRFHADIRDGSLNILDDNDITVLLCNLLDNAIEACDGIVDGTVDLSAIVKPEHNLVLITLINSTRTEPVMDANGEYVTSKKDKKAHGFGVKSINRVVSKYNGDSTMYYADGMFHSVISIPMAG